MLSSPSCGSVFHQPKESDRAPGNRTPWTRGEDSAVREHIGAVLSTFSNADEAYSYLYSTDSKEDLRDKVNAVHDGAAQRKGKPRGLFAIQCRVGILSAELFLKVAFALGKEPSNQFVDQVLVHLLQLLE